MPPFRSDEPLWYAVGTWGELGYAVPAFGDNPVTLNQGISYLVDVMGRNLSAIMHHPDVDLRTPPSINTLTRIHKLVVRARQILASRAVRPGLPDMESVHSAPALVDFLVFPIPFFRVRNHWLKEYAGLMLASLSEACQHTENRKPYEISTTFAGLVGQYLHRVYRRMGAELFGVSPELTEALDFTLTSEQLAAYDPSKFFTSTEMIDVAPPSYLVPTEDDLRPLTDGIPATRIAGLTRWPSPIVDTTATGGSSSSGSSSAAAGKVGFAPAPGP